MSLILSGTDGLSDVDGSAATPAIRGTDANTGIFFPAADTIAFAEGGAEVARFDSSGNFGLGVTPSAWGTTSKAMQFSTGAFEARSASFSSNTNAYFNSGWLYVGTGRATLYNQTAGQHVWYNSASGTAGNAITFTQAMTLDASGNLLVGLTSGLGGLVNIPVTASLWGIGLKNTGASGNMIVFLNSSGTSVGSIFSDASSTSYVTSSDYRLKNTISPMTDALAKVALFKPVTYKWNIDGSDGQGFIAHELAEVCPQAVTGEKDAVNEDGSIKPQGIDTSFLVATLTAAIQEQQALITTLTARITALESA